MRTALYSNRFVAMTIGDINGIGPEIVLKSIRHVAERSRAVPLLVGPLRVFSQYARRLGLPLKFERVSLSGILDWQASHISCGLRTIPVVEPSHGTPVLRPGKVSSLAGRIAAQAIKTAVALLQMGAAEAMVTAPASKRALHKAGIRFSGQTELLQSLTRSPRVGMMMVSPVMRIGLVTIHVPMKDLVGKLSQRLVRERIQLFRHALIADWGILHPRMAVLALNPHGGEGGDLGPEEQRLITPVLHSLLQDGLDIAGPFPADGFFAGYRPERYDAVIAMYHDQGLIPLKMTAQGRAVNVTAGLPIVRTSPAHGTAFDIAGTLTADPRSMIEAVTVALQIAAVRQETGTARPLSASRGRKLQRKRR